MELVPNYFFLKDKIYKKLRVVKSEDYIVVWSYEDEMRQRFTYSLVRKEATKAYRLNEVCDLLDKKIRYIVSYLDRGLIPYPASRLYHIISKKPSKWMWSQEDILYMRDLIFQLAPKDKHGDPRRDFSLISKAELLAKMHGNSSYYVKNENGEFVRVWKNI